MISTAGVRAVNRLAARWAGGLGDRDTVFMPAGVWPLLAFLAAGARGPALGELEEALGLPAATAVPAARDLLAARPGVAAALGLWTREAVAPRADWLALLGPDVHEALTGDPVQDQPRLDAWAARMTDGLIDSMPVAVDEHTRLVLASALTVRTEWLQPFWECGHGITAGPWAGRDLRYLGRVTALLDRVSVADTPAGPLTRLEVLGDNGIDAHLLLGAPEARPAEVLGAGLDLLTGRHQRITGDRLPDGAPGPGLTAGWRRSYDRDPQLHVTVPEFTVDAEHDLLRPAEPFGLAHACRDGDHFPGITTAEPLKVGSARQRATAVFSRRGFRAAAVTAIGAVACCAPPSAPPPYRVRHVELTVDRPFGFLAVHRSSRLVLAAGWVSDPTVWTDNGDWE